MILECKVRQLFGRLDVRFLQGHKLDWTRVFRACVLALEDSQGFEPNARVTRRDVGSI